MTEFQPAVEAVTSRRDVLRALSKNQSPDIAKAAAQSLVQLTQVERKLKALDAAEKERQAMKALLDNARDETTRTAIKNAMTARSLQVLDELVARDKAARR